MLERSLHSLCCMHSLHTCSLGQFQQFESCTALTASKNAPKGWKRMLVIAQRLRNIIDVFDPSPAPRPPPLRSPFKVEQSGSEVHGIFLSYWGTLTRRKRITCVVNASGLSSCFVTGIQLHFHFYSQDNPMFLHWLAGVWSRLRQLSCSRRVHFFHYTITELVQCSDSAP